MNFISSVCLVICVLCAGCQSAASFKYKDAASLRPGEAIAVGRLQILNNGKDLTRGSFLTIRTEGGKAYLYPVDADGFFCVRCPVGTNYLDQFIVRGLKGYLTTKVMYINLTEPGQAYYIGDMKTETLQKAGDPDGRTLQVLDNLTETQNEYRAQFPNAPQSLITSKVVKTDQEIPREKRPWPGFEH